MSFSLAHDFLAIKFRRDVVKFLKTDLSIGKVNFCFQGYKVYPSCYRVDISKAIDKSDIEIRAKKLSGRLMAQYWDSVLFWDDELVLSEKFNILDPVQQSYLIHECTHAHLDNQKLGEMKRDLNEAICYTAQHVWLMAFVKAKPGRVTIPKGRIHAAAHNIAKQIFGGGHAQYFVDAKLAQVLRQEIRTDPDYAKVIRRHPTVTSDGV